MRVALLGLAGTAGVALAAPAPDSTPAVVLCDAVRAAGAGADDAQQPLVLGMDGWIFRPTDLAPPYVVSDATVAGLARFVTDLRARGTALAVLLLPPRGAVASQHVDRAEPLASAFDPGQVAADYASAVAALGRSGALVPDLLQAAIADGSRDQYYFARDHHWRPEGARSAMRALASLAATAGLDFSPSAWTNVAKTTRAYPGSFANRVERECGGQRPPPEAFTLYESVPDGTAPGTLLGDWPPAEVVLAGASHTNKGGDDQFNVGGWLREALGTDVLNVGVDAGGYRTGLLDWIGTEGTWEHPPRLLAWEISGRVPGDLAEFFRQAVPALYGDCAVPLAAGAIPGAAGRVPALVVPAATPSGGSYLVVDVAEPAVAQFNVVFDVEGGTPEGYAVRRSTRLAHSGRFFVEAPLVRSRLRAVDLVFGAGDTTSVQTRLCALPPDEAGVAQLHAAR